MEKYESMGGPTPQLLQEASRTFAKCLFDFGGFFPPSIDFLRKKLMPENKVGTPPIKKYRYFFHLKFGVQCRIGTFLVGPAPPHWYFSFYLFRHVFQCPPGQISQPCLLEILTNHKK